MNIGQLCPVCGNELGADRLLSGTIVCACGYSDERARAAAERRSEQRAIVGFMVFCSALLIFFAHAISWGGHMWRIPFLKASHMIGTISAEGMDSLIQACFDRSKWECVQDVHVELFQKTKNPAVLARLADFRQRLNREDDAILTYDWYVRVGGQESEALYRYADLLERQGKVTQAIELYAKSVATSGERLPVRAMSGLLRLFMQEGRSQEALDHLKAFHESSGNAKDYFASELQKLEETLKKSKRVAKR